MTIKKQEINLILQNISEAKVELQKHHKEIINKLVEIENGLKSIMSENSSVTKKKGIVIRAEPRVEFGEVEFSPYTKRVMDQNEAIIRRYKNKGRLFSSQFQ